MSSSSSSSAATLKLNRGEAPYDVVRRTSQWMLSVSQHVRIDGDALRRFAISLPISEIMNPSVRKGFPLKFQSLAAEINFMALLNVLNFGSGYRTLLHRYIDRGAYDTICFGCIGMHLSGDIDADFLVRVSLHEVSSLFLIPVDEDYTISLGITSTRAHALRPLAEALRATLNAAGATLRAYQCADFSQFLLDTPRGIEVVDDGKGAPVRAADLIARLVKAFPVMADHYTINTTTETNTVWLLKKAQLLCSELYTRFGKEVPKFNFVDIDHLTVFADNVLPAVLRQAGVLQVSTKLGAILDAEKTLTDVSMECALRSAAIIAIDLIRAVLADPLSSDVAAAITSLPHPSFDVAGAYVAKSSSVTTTTATLSSSSSSDSKDSKDNKDTATSSVVASTVMVPSVAPAAVAAAPSSIPLVVSVTTAPSSAPVVVACRDIDYYLWQVYGKRPDVRAYPRHAAISLYY